MREWTHVSPAKVKGRGIKRGPAEATPIKAASTSLAKKVVTKSDEESVNSALSRGIKVLRAFRVGDGTLTNAELAKRTNLPRPTISRITATLTEIGCLSYVERLASYKLGGTAIAIGRVASANFDLLQVARPLMQRLADDSGLTVAIGTLEKNRMVYMDACQGPALIALQLKVGSRLPMLSTAMGRAFLATLPEDKRQRFLETHGPTDVDERQRGTLSIERAAGELQKRGFCIVAGDWYPDINGVAAPVITGEGYFVLNCGGPAYILPPERMVEEIGPRLAAIAKEISAHIGS